MDTTKMQIGLKTFVTVLSAVAGAAALVLVTGLATTQRASATMKYTRATGKPCAFCHARNRPPALNDQGKKFQARGHKL